MDAIDTTGARLKRANRSGRACRPVAPGGREVEILQLGEEVIVGEEEALDRTVEDHHLQISIAFKRF